MEEVKVKKALRNITIFSLIVVSCGWVGRLVDLKVGTDTNGSLGQLIWIITPLLAMIVFRTFMGDRWKDFGIRPRLMGNGILYAFCILFYPIIASVIVLIGNRVGWLEGSIFSSAFLTACLMALIPAFIKNIFEEFAWRGYLAPRLLSLGYNRMIIHIYVGIIWGVWHIPYLFKFVETTESMFTFIPRFLIGVVAMSIVYGEILLITKSVWPAVFMHTGGNAFIDTMIIQKYINVNEGFHYVAMPSPEGIITILITAATGFWLYKRSRT